MDEIDFNFIATARGNPSALALVGIATRAIDRSHEDMVQYAQQEAVEGTPQGENGLKNAAPNDTRFRPQGLERQASSECQSLVGQPTCKPTGFSRGYLTVSHLEDKIKNLGETEGTMVKDAVNAGLAGYLKQILGWIKTAVKVERDRIQSAKDATDATLYALASPVPMGRWFSTYFDKELGKVEWGIDFGEDQKKPKRGEEGVFDCRKDSGQAGGSEAQAEVQDGEGWQSKDTVCGG